MVRKLGALSKLALSPDEIERFGEQAEKIIGYFQSLRGLDLSGVEPTSHVVDVECFRRPDERGETLKCLADKFPYLNRYGYFPVPRILPEDSPEHQDTDGAGIQKHQDTKAPRDSDE
jgi:aspartyl/glutamyl-tRNA(Asn/Gln) amidotransferase C subunit